MTTTTSPLPRTRRPIPVWGRLLAVPIVAATLVVGLWVTGGKITDDFAASMALTALWFAVAGAGALFVAWRWRPLALPVLATFALTAAGLGGYLAWTTFRDTVVNERVVTAAPGSGNVALARGSFVSGAHHTAGTAAIVHLPAGGRKLTLIDLDTSPGPDLRVYLTRPGAVGDHVDLGGLRGNKGTQQYDVPATVDIRRYSDVVIWCRAFSVEFGTAALRPAAAT